MNKRETLARIVEIARYAENERRSAAAREDFGEMHYWEGRGSALADAYELVDVLGLERAPLERSETLKRLQ